MTPGSTHTLLELDRVPDLPQLTDPLSISPADDLATTSSPTPTDSMPPSPPAVDPPDPILAASPSVLTPLGDRRPRTRLHNNISKVKDFGQDIIIYDPTKSGFLAQVMPLGTTESVPLTYTEALRPPHWRQAMQDEYDALVKNGTWQLAPPQPDINVVD
jgi:hypothetical protein